MKTERRHELQTNTLAVTLARWIEVLKPYSRAGLALIIAMVVAIFAWGYLSAQNSRRTADGWNEYFEATMSRDSVERLTDIAQQYAGTPVGEWSRIALADLQLDQGTNRLFFEKIGARDELRQAAETYQAILLESSEPMLSQHAMFGLARAHEAQAAFDKSAAALDKARDEYRSIATQWPNSPFAPAALARARDLDRPATKSFYDWLARYEPPRPLAREPGTPGVRPDFTKDPLSDGGFNVPQTSNDNSLQLNISGETAGDKPADAADEKPAEPAAEKPAEPAAPADGGEAEPQTK